MVEKTNNIDDAEIKYKQALKNYLERPHPTDVGWGFYGLAPVKPR